MQFEIFHFPSVLLIFFDIYFVMQVNDGSEPGCWDN